MPIKSMGWKGEKRRARKDAREFYERMKQERASRSRAKQWPESQNGPVITSVSGGVSVREFEEKTRSQYEYRQKYLRGDHWKKLRERILERARYCCEDCGKKVVPIDVHHLTYVRKGAELESDLVAVCRPCHDIRHARNGYLSPNRAS